MVQSHLLLFLNLGNFVHPTFALCLSEEILKAGGPFYMYGVYARESKRFHTRGKCITVGD